MGYLDNAGLAHLWGKIKGYVSTPTKTLTQAEYNALSEEEKQADILYAITDDGGSSGGGASTGEVYSTEETQIGTWIDGKPLYRKVVQSTFASASSTWQVISPPIASAVMQKISAYFRFPGGSFESIPTVDSKSVATRIMYNPGGGVQLSSNQKDWIGSDIIIILEYTKTANLATVDQSAVLSTPTTATTTGAGHIEEV